VHYFDPATRSYNQKSMAIYIEKGAKIVNVVLSRNQEVLQSLYVVYQKDAASKGAEAESYLKVFKQTPTDDGSLFKAKFEENTDSEANKVQLQANS